MCACGCGLAGLRSGDGYLLAIFNGRAGSGTFDRAGRGCTGHSILRGIALDLDFCDGAVALAAAVTGDQTVVGLFAPLVDAHRYACLETYRQGRVVATFFSHPQDFRSGQRVDDLPTESGILHQDVLATRIRSFYGPVYELRPCLLVVVTADPRVWECQVVVVVAGGVAIPVRDGVIYFELVIWDGISIGEDVDRFGTRHLLVRDKAGCGDCGGCEE